MDNGDAAVRPLFLHLFRSATIPASWATYPQAVPLSTTPTTSVRRLNWNQRRLGATDTSANNVNDGAIWQHDLQFMHACITDLGPTDVQKLELGQAAEMLQPGIGYPCVFE